MLIILLIDWLSVIQVRLFLDLCWSCAYDGRCSGEGLILIFFYTEIVCKERIICLKEILIYATFTFVFKLAFDYVHCICNTHDELVDMIFP